MKENIPNNLGELSKLRMLMIYDTSKTATENLFLEQKTDFSGYDILNPMNPNYGKKTNDDPLGLKNWDTHDWLSLIQILLFVLGLFTAGITSAIALGMGTITGLADAVVYLVKDKNLYMGVMSAILSFIPGDEVFKLPGIGQVIKKRGIGGVQNLIKKYKDGVDLTKAELDDIVLLGEKLRENSQTLKNILSIGTKKILIEQLSKKSTKWIMNFLVKFKKFIPVIYVGGSAFTFDQIYVTVFEDDIKKMDLRNKSIYIQVANWVKSKLSGEEITQEDLLKTAEEAFQKLTEKAKKGEMTLGEWAPPKSAVDEKVSKDIVK
jgi:hypothetical protein